MGRQVPEPQMQHYGMTTRNSDGACSGALEASPCMCMGGGGPRRLCRGDLARTLREATGVCWSPGGQKEKEDSTHRNHYMQSIKAPVNRATLGVPKHGAVPVIWA